MADLIPDEQFEVSSGALCFGEPHNIKHGASVPIVTPNLVNPKPCGTVIVHDIEYNIAAVNGQWQAYKLFRRQNAEDPDPAEPTAWFACHESVAPEEECRRILRVSGSPYDDYSGPTMNCEQTMSGRVLIINRYDWGYYDHRGKGDDYEALMDTLEYPSVGLVDRAQVTDTSHVPHAWGDRGVWMTLRGVEYMFGRFGLTENRTRAHSFLFFSAHTSFPLAYFAGQRQEPVWKPPTHEEVHAKRIADGSYLRSFPPGQPAGPLVGPFVGQGGDILSMADLKFFVSAYAPKTPLEPALEDHVHILLNEMVCTWMVTCFNAIGECSNVEALIAALLPRNAEERTIDIFMAAAIRDTTASTVLFPGFDHTALCGAIRAFLERYCATSPVRALLSPLQVAAMMKFLLGEVLQMAANSVPGSRQVIVPCDVRSGVYLDPELFKLLDRCKAYWPPEDSS